MLFVGVRGCHRDLRILSILAVRLPKLALKASRVLIRSRGRWGILNLLFVGVRGCHGDLRILSILAVRLPKRAVGAHLELIIIHGRWGVLNLLFLGVRGCPWVSRRLTYFVDIGFKTAQTCCGGSFRAY